MTSSLWLLAFAIVSSSFFGSWHCAAMCSPIASLMARRNSLWSYHGGRLLSYSVLGLLAGFAGEFFLNSEFVFLRIIASLLLAVVLLTMGLKILVPRFFEHNIFRKVVAITQPLHRFSLSQSGFVVGLMTAFLPCGWLYTYVMAAVATRSPWAGFLVMSLFWLGGLPALSALPAMLKGGLANAGLRQQKIGGAILVIAGLYSIASFFFLH